MGQHDLIGNFELGLEEDILVGKAVENPVITCWYPLHYKGISRGRGKLKLEFRWSNRYMKLTVKLVAGKELPRMDRFGLCDPFVKIKITDKPVVHLFSGSFDTKAHMWDIKTGKVLHGFAMHDRQVSKICCADVLHTHCLLTASLDHTVIVWDIKNRSQLKRLLISSPVTSVSIHSVMMDEIPDVNLEEITSQAKIKLQISFEFDHDQDQQKLSVDVCEACALPAMGKVGLCDPFVTVSLNDVTKKTQTKRNTLNPSWMEHFEFTDFTLDMELIVKVHDCNVRKLSYIGNCAVSLEPLKSHGRVQDWYEIKHTAYQKIYLFTGSCDKKLRMYDIRVGTCQRDFAGHTGSITDVQLHNMRGDKQLFSSSIDGHVKLWDIRDSTHHVISAVNTWTHPAGVTALCVTYIAGQVRIFATCQDSILYMWTLPAIAMIVDNGYASIISALRKKKLV
jgi:WD40 repeat protein